MKNMTASSLKLRRVAARSFEPTDCEGCVLPTEQDILRFQRALKAISGKWKIELICSLIDGPLRFGSLRRRLPGVTQHMLTLQLKELTSAGILIRTAHPGIPARVDYELSQAGIELIPVLNGLLSWSHNHDAIDHDDSVGLIE